MMLVAFFSGLMIGIGLCLWQRWQFQRKVRHLLQLFQFASGEVSLALLPRLRREILHQQLYQQQLQDQLQTYEALLQALPLGYIQVDEENQLLWCNQQAQQLLNIDRWEPKQVRLLLELVRSYEIDQLIEQTREQQQPEVREWVFHPAATNAVAMSGKRSLTLRASSLPLPDGQVGVFIENCQPLVDLVQTRDRLISDLAHELRTPLTSIRLVVETLQEQVQPPLRRWVERLLIEVERLINLVQSLLELNQLEANSKHLNCQPLEVRSLIYSVWQTLEPLAQLRHLSFTYSEPGTVWLSADQPRLYRLFFNLLDNSIKYSPSGGNIRIEVNLLPSETPPQQVQINIIDSGCGFANSDLPHIFERLYRGDPARTKQVSVSHDLASNLISTGCGLGLAIAKQIVIAHHGSIKAMNHPETAGAWLQVELPYNVADANK